MSQPQYNIVFSGELMPGIELASAKENLARLFKSEVAAIERLFEQGEVVLKRALNEVEASRYLAALEGAGVQARKEQHPAVEAFALSLDGEEPATSDPVAETPSASANRAVFGPKDSVLKPADAPPSQDFMCCPKCGHSQPKADSCSSCGVIISKFLAIQAASQPEPAPTEVAAAYAAPFAMLDDNLPDFDELKVFTFEGRIGRLRLLAWNMVLMFAVALLFIPFGAAMALSKTVGALLLAGGLVAMAVVSFMIGVKRLHDIGWSGWLILLNLVPVVGSVFPLILAVVPGNEGANRYGAPPPPNSTGVKVLAGLSIATLVLAIIGIAAAIAIPAMMSGVVPGR